MGCVDLADLAVQRQSGALQGRIAPNAGQRYIGVLLQTHVKALALGGQKVDTVCIVIHQVDGARHRQSQFIDGGDDDHVDLMDEHVQIVFCFHEASSFSFG